MAYWLFKTEPDCYSWEKFTTDKRTIWDGITNALALKNLRTAKKGDLAFFYHTGTERAVIGIAEVISNPYPDPKEQDDKLAVVDVKLIRKFRHPVTLSDIKADPAFAGWDLLRLGRLSVVPVPEKMWKRIEELGNNDD
jgi:predicted RNA-binding protein with PUA-like domain